MIYETVYLKDLYKNIGETSKLEIYCPSNSKEMNINRKRKTILCLPGGGYTWTSDREAEVIALRFISYDFNVFVLRYECPPKEYPRPVTDAIAALDYINKNKDKYNVDKVCVMGFSAGGNLAGNVANYANRKDFQNLINVDNHFDLFAVVLGYPVINLTLPGITHQGTSNEISHLNNEYKKEFSVELNMTKDFPPTYVWHTLNDQTVNIKNTYLLDEKLNEYGIKHITRLYEKGVHGLSTGDLFTYPENPETREIVKRGSDVRGWVMECIDFLNSL